MFPEVFSPWMMSESRSTLALKGQGRAGQGKAGVRTPGRAGRVVDLIAGRMRTFSRG